LNALRTALRDLGLLGVLGLALGIGALSGDRYWNTPLSEEVSTLSSRVERLEHRVAQFAERTRNPADKPFAGRFSPEQRLEAFYLFFAREQPITDYLALMHGYARAFGVTVGSADYRKTPITGLPLTAVTVSLPASGRYGDLKGFMETILSEIPVAALDRVSMRRRPKDGVVDASIELTLFLPAERG
jgi:hypothetical protein